MSVSFIDLARVHKPEKEAFAKAFEECIANSDFILGDSVKRFESNFARQMGAKYALGVGSGTDALLLALSAVGVGPGDEVIVPAFGFVATADVVFRLGATIVFADINENYTIDVESVRAAITERTKAIIPVHLYGQAADINELSQVAADYQLYLIEDCAQSAGAHIEGRQLGTYGIAGCFSFYPTKNLGGMGDGGAIITNSDELYDRVKLFRDHGRDESGNFITIGYNSRLDSIQAAMLDIKLESLDEDNADRIANAEYYNNALSADFYALPTFNEDGQHVYGNYTIRHANRDELQRFLSERNIETRIYYKKPLHLEPCFEWLGYRPGHFPNAELAAEQVLSLPIYPGLTRQELEEVSHTIELYAKTHPVSV